MTKTSYYTGHEDLDERLAKLYDLQVTAESEGRDTAHIIKIQDRLLSVGWIRDNFGVEEEQ